MRIVRLALEEKGLPYRLEEVDIFAEGGPSAAYLKRHPFGRIPAFEHDGFGLYEAAAIVRYIDEAFDGPALQPAGLAARTRMNQAIAVLDRYAYRTLVWDVYVESTRDPAEGAGPDKIKIAAALPRAALCLNTLADLKSDGKWLAGDEFSLADLFAAPMFAYFTRTEEGRTLLDGEAGLRDWWRAMAERESMARTRFPDEAGAVT